MTSRARRLHQYLVDIATSRSLAQIRADALPECSSLQVQSCINGLLKYRKIKHVTRGHGRNTYAAVRGVPVERRNQKYANAAEREQARRTAKPAPVSARIAAQLKAQPAATVMHGSALGTHSALTKADQSARIAADIAAFEARGGRIQHLRNGEISQPLKHIGATADFLASRAKGRATQSQRRKA